jgi:hypothetical protein
MLGVMATYLEGRGLKTMASWCLEIMRLRWLLTVETSFEKIELELNNKITPPASCGLIRKSQTLLLPVIY